jgi:hypothetical protein
VTEYGHSAFVGFSGSGGTGELALHQATIIIQGSMSCKNPPGNKERLA